MKIGQGKFSLRLANIEPMPSNLLKQGKPQ